MKDELKAETKVFNAVKRGIEAGAIQNGQSKDEISKCYGKPVVILPEENNGEKWIYKPGHASHFDSEKICLHFDANGQLIRIE